MVLYFSLGDKPKTVKDETVDYFEACGLQNEKNQRFIMLYGTGRNRQYAQSSIQHLTKNLTKALFRLDLISDNINTENERMRLNYSIKQLYQRPIFERTSICCQVARHIVTACYRFIKQQSNVLPSIYGIIRLFSLLDNVCFAPHILVGFVAKLSSLAKPIEVNLKQNAKKRASTPTMSNQEKKHETLQSMSGQQAIFFTRTLLMNASAIARQYHSLFVIEACSSKALQTTFDGFWSLVKQSKPSECSSSERNTLMVLYQQWVSCNGIILSHLKENDKNYQKTIDDLKEKLGWPADNLTKRTQSVHMLINDVNSDSEPLVGVYNSTLCKQILDNPLAYINTLHARKVAKNFQDDSKQPICDRYSFICNVIKRVCFQNQSLKEICHLAALSAEMSSYVSKFSNAWMSALEIIISNIRPTITQGGWQDCLNVNLSDVNVYEPLSTLIICLLVREVIKFDKLKKTLISAINNVNNEIKQKNKKSELDMDPRLLASAKFSLYLTTRIYADSCPPSAAFYSWKTKNRIAFDGARIKDQKTFGFCGISIQADRRLLASLQENIDVLSLFTVTKLLIVLADTNSPEVHSEFSGRNSRRIISPSAASYTLVYSPVAQYAIDSAVMKTDSLHTIFKSNSFGLLSRKILKLITAQQSVKECFITAKSSTWTSKCGLGDDWLEPRQRQSLLQHFLYPRKMTKEFCTNPFDESSFLASNG